MHPAITLALALLLAFVAGHEETNVSLSGMSTLTRTNTNSFTKYTTPEHTNSSVTQTRSLDTLAANTIPSVIASTIIVDETTTTTIFVQPTTAGQHTNAGPDTLSEPSVAAAKKPGKRGIPYNDPKYTKNFGGPNSPVTWQYNWNSNPYVPATLSPGQLNQGLKYIPQLWSLAAELVAQWAPAVTAAIKDHNADALLAYNEPDFCKPGAGASCMTDVAAAVKGYKDHMSAYYKKNLKLGMPAVTNAETGIPWAKKFLELCTDCQIDVAPMHFYTDTLAPFSYFTGYVQNFTQLVKPRKVWITEFALSDGDAKANAEFLKKALVWLDANEDVERYSWFMAGPGEARSLVNVDGSLTALGTAYNQ
ncbi:hypothetical protein FKW77_001892 [Venturia effusa]|uniref:Asl1-like glycosyl hydrolase catalytic domain-containing protein n=1 Tax=Venturia effusa TaxID=50376 RepID=A0A517L6S2_9PEZI|nr:hypothetical protein FKW77_001892 [Venturia effusa]